jgi:hypothetical protein
MKKAITFLLWAALFTLALGTRVMASDIYFAQVAAGANNGTNCANAYSASRFNTNDMAWGAGIIAANTDRRLILLTHWWLSANGTMSDHAGQSPWGDSDNNGAHRMFTTMVAPSSNVVAGWGGHIDPPPPQRRPLERYGDGWALRASDSVRLSGRKRQYWQWLVSDLHVLSARRFADWMDRREDLFGVAESILGGRSQPV